MRIFNQLFLLIGISAYLFLWEMCSPKQTIEETQAIKQNPKFHFLDWIDTSCAIAYVALDMEALAGLEVRVEEYAFVDRFLEQMRTQIKVKPHYTRKEAIQILQLIDRALQASRDAQMPYGHAFSMALRYRKFDCDIQTFLYLSVAQELKLPIYAYLMPNHITVVWKDDEREIIWETTHSRVRTKQYYVNKYQLNKEALEKGILLQNLTRQQLVALIFYNLGKTYTNNRSFANSVNYTREAMQLAPKWYQPYQSLAKIHREAQFYESSIYYCQKALQLHPNLLEMYHILGIAYADIGCNTEAIDAYQSYLNQLPKHYYDYPIILKQTQEKIKELDR